MRTKKLFLILALLCAVAQGAWAQNGIYCTASDKNRVVCTDGSIYDNVAAATADGKTAAAMIIYIDEVNKKGLALALKDEARNTQDGGITACNNKNTSMPVVGGTWKLASKSEWDSMISAAGSSPTLHDGFSSVGGTNMDVNVYWSSEKDGSNGLLLQYYFGWSDFVSNSQYANIRACLTFNLLTLYEIGSQSEWNEFCTAVYFGSTLIGDTFSDKYVKLTSDIIVSEMAGSSESNSFQGLFDGDGHTLTVSYNTEYAVTAPFRYVKNATIRNLKTTGTITTGGMNAAGIVGEVTGSLNLSSCNSSVSISSSRPQMDAHGGLVASNNGNVTISGCVFDGSFAATAAHNNQYGTTFCGGIVGMCVENTSTTITNSLVAPSSVAEGMVSKTFVGLDDNATVTIENCYFVATANLPTNQGTQVYYTAPANEISKSITISGTTVYYACSVSGVEAAYDLDQGLVFITPTVTDPSAATLTFGTDYTATLNGNAVQNLPVKISTAGGYTLVLTGAGSYTGTKTFNITAIGDPVNSALIISSETEWDTFAESVNNGNNYSNQFVKLTADISVSTMVGTSETNSFQGTFLGDGTHTLTFTKGTAESAFGAENCAPFRYTKNATIRDLKVTGTIYTSRKFAAGLVARNSGTTTITNCQIGTVIHSSVSGDGTHGGIVAMPAGSTTTTITGCVYNGRLLTTSGTQYCGGFVGWSGDNTVTVAHSLYAPDANIVVAAGETAINHGATFVRGNTPTVETSCYYTETMGSAQGTRAIGTATAPANFGDLVQDYGMLQVYGNGILYDGTYYVAPATVSLADNADNSTTISGANGYFADVTLQGRTLYKDGKWNTLCLPFDVTLAGSALNGATARPLTAASISGTTLNLTFGDAVTTLVAGIPYIIKWTKADGYDQASEDARDIKNPVFNGVTIDKTDNSYDNGVSGEERVRFLGTYKSTTFDAEDKSILFLGDANTLYYPLSGASLGAQRAYFKIGKDGGSARQITDFDIDFGDSSETTGILNSKISILNSSDAAWYTLDGRKLEGQPTKKGLYLHGGRKVVIK